MNQYSFTFFSKNPIKIHVDDNILYSIDNNNVHFATILSNNNYVSISLSTDLGDKLITVQGGNFVGKEELDYTIISKNNSTFDVYLHPVYHSPYKHVVFHHNTKDLSIVVTQGYQNECCVYDPFAPCDYCYFDPCDNYHCHYSHPYLILIGQKNLFYYVIIIHEQEKKIIFHDTINEYQLTDECCTFLHNMNDHYHHARVTKVTKDGLSHHYVFTSSTRQLNVDSQLIPYLFLECIKSEDYTNARYWLSNDLRPSNHHLAQYFGKFSNIYYVDTIKDDVIYTIQDDKNFRKYLFSIKNNRISNINNQDN